jgi:hypothetical protein
LRMQRNRIFKVSCSDGTAAKDEYFHEELEIMNLFLRRQLSLGA